MTIDKPKMKSGGVTHAFPKSWNPPATSGTPKVEETAGWVTSDP